MWSEAAKWLAKFPEAVVTGKRSAAQPLAASETTAYLGRQLPPPARNRTSTGQLGGYQNPAAPRPRVRPRMTRTAIRQDAGGPVADRIDK
jgi:hypothetical protein